MRASTYRTRVRATELDLAAVAARLQRQRTGLEQTASIADADRRTHTLLDFLEACERGVAELVGRAGMLLVADAPALPETTEGDRGS